MSLSKLSITKKPVERKKNSMDLVNLENTTPSMGVEGKPERYFKTEEKEPPSREVIGPIGHHRRFTYSMLRKM